MKAKVLSTLRERRAVPVDDSLAPPYTGSWKLLVTPIPPAQGSPLRFKRMLLSLSNMPLQWENPGLLDEALCVVPLERLYSEADEESSILEAEAASLGDGGRAAWGYQDCVVRALLRWFKRSFFTWSNNPPCSACQNATTAVGICAPTDEEQARSAKQVELYKCASPSCDAYERFPRYSDPFVLLQTRRGRSGEWANCFGMLCRALGSRVRWVWNAEDHTWIETFSVHRNRWVHVDPCEEVWDQPQLYTVGWVRKLTYCIAFSTDGAVDVTPRYVRGVKHSSPRTRCTEAELLHILAEITMKRRETMSEQDTAKLKDEHDCESMQFRKYLIAGLVHEVCNHLTQHGTRGRCDVDAEPGKSLGERTSGDRTS
ncbi:uncharacterized protein M421DRAFT_395323 [Didymella exigua CBS 183.55]|uniref:Transglutaminase-like domain-containing protein n=1 Tax=Didymella exigua CBS 183.55 TaxID=1150837 RepID=A0A6A5S213_9PLEO|nr:uncharacterized protein M421DRAFT_395323 [Didymella exigua CBS 183.55]KAF1933338.1 hypothetical protein M421DRAFT_395323 [Didymella exigua CBS 183.55]